MPLRLDMFDLYLHQKQIIQFYQNQLVFSNKKQ